MPDIFLYSGEASANDIKLRDPTVSDGGGGGPTGRLKVWMGAAWLEKPTKVWTGGAWIEKPVKFWNGSTWTLA